MYSGLSIFDLDHTLLSVNSSYYFGAYLFKKGFFRFPVLVWCLFLYVCHKFFGMSVKTLHSKIFVCLFQGCPIFEIQRYVKEFLDQDFSRLLAPMLMKRLEEAIQKGHYTVILSSSPDFLVQEIAERMNVHDWRATHYGKDEWGILTSVHCILEGKDKAYYLQMISEKYRIERSKIYAYTDSHLDLPLLEKAGVPFGVNPDSRLKKVCIERGWEIL